MITFPGHGTPGKRCGFHRLHGCKNCLEYFDVRSKCMKKTCPDCYPDWARRQGNHAAERMTEFMGDKRYKRWLVDAERERWEAASLDPDASREEKRHYRIQTYHIVVSFRDAELSDREDIARLRKDARCIVRRHGSYGECSIPHTRGEGDDGAHIHFLALAGFIRPGGPDDQYIIEVIEHERGWYPRNVLDRFNVVKYACTHAVITEDSDCVTWSGCVANNKYPGVAEKDFIPQGGPLCPMCKSSWTYKVVGEEWVYGSDEDVWTGPDRPPPDVPQRALREFA